MARRRLALDDLAFLRRRRDSVEARLMMICDRCGSTRDVKRILYRDLCGECLVELRANTMTIHAIRCKRDGRALAMLEGGGVCVCPSADECRDPPKRYDGPCAGGPRNCQMLVS